jgi:hypothetical protein
MATVLAGLFGGDLRLVFDTIEGQKYLTKVRTANKTFALVKTKSEKSASR